MYENISATRLREFKNLIKSMKDLETLIERTFTANGGKFKSARLSRLSRYKIHGDARESGDLPKVSSFLSVLEQFVNLDQQERIGGRLVDHPLPQAGLIKEYDKTKEKI